MHRWYIGHPFAGEAVIITRGLQSFNHTLMDVFGGHYLVQTNYDPWKPDNPGDPRRTVALQTLQVCSPAF